MPGEGYLECYVRLAPGAMPKQQAVSRLNTQGRPPLVVHGSRIHVQRCQLRNRPLVQRCYLRNLPPSPTASVRLPTGLTITYPHLPHSQPGLVRTLPPLHLCQGGKHPRPHTHMRMFAKSQPILSSPKFNEPCVAPQGLYARPRMHYIIILDCLGYHWCHCG